MYQHAVSVFVVSEGRTELSASRRIHAGSGLGPPVMHQEESLHPKKWLIASSAIAVTQPEVSPVAHRSRSDILLKLSQSAWVAVHMRGLLLGVSWAVDLTIRHTHPRSSPGFASASEYAVAHSVAVLNAVSAMFKVLHTACCTLCSMYPRGSPGMLWKAPLGLPPAPALMH